MDAIPGVNSHVRPVHFEDFSGREFERLVFAYALRVGWEDAEWIGEAGSDGGRDIICHGRNGLSLLMCANYRDLTYRKAKSDLDKAGVLQPRPNEVIVIGGGSVSADLRGKIKNDAAAIGFNQCKVWSGAELEERIRMKAADLLKRFCDGIPFPESADEVRALARRTPNNVGHFGVPDTHKRNPFFVEDGLVQGALLALKPGDALVLRGSAGVGKTQSAVQFARTHGKEFSHVFWLSAASLPILHDAFAGLVDAPELEGPSAIDRPLPERIQMANAWLKQNADWLLIFDNADSPDVASEIERLIPGSHTGKVLITSQYTGWTPAFLQREVVFWEKSRSKAFLKSRLTTIASDDEGFDALATILDGLPLALEQAAAYITETKITPTRYVELFKADAPRHLTRHIAAMTEYRSSVATAWFITIRRLSFIARYFLRICSCLSTEPIPRRIFDLIPKSAAEDDTHSAPELRALRRAFSVPDVVDVALGELASYSLISLSPTAVTCHSLLQATLREDVRLSWRHFGYRIRRYYMKVDKKQWTSALWPRRTLALLSTDRAVPGSIGFRDISGTSEFAPHLEAVLSYSQHDCLKTLTVRLHLEARLDWFRHKVTEHESGLDALKRILMLTADRVPRLKSETEWFLANFEGLCERIPSLEVRERLANRLVSLPQRSPPGPRGNPYGLIRALAEAQVDAGDLATARRLFRFAFDHACEDEVESIDDAGCARIDEALLLCDELTRDEVMGLVREGMELLEPKNASNHFFINGAAAYASRAKTDDEIERALRWANAAATAARSYLPIGYSPACNLALAHGQLLWQLDRNEDALSVVDTTLAPAIRMPKIRREYLVLLWELRAILLDERGAHVRAGRSYVRCLNLERKYRKPSADREKQLLQKAARAFALGGYERVAEEFAAEAK